MATKPPEEAVETLKYQTWVLKVSIHCEGCKKKVKKVLQGIEGVYTTTVDSQQHKVTVTGNVDADTLLKKLQRAGKLAELWPEKKEKKSGKKKNNEKQKDQKDNTEDGGDDEQRNTDSDVGEIDNEDGENEEAGGESAGTNGGGGGGGRGGGGGGGGGKKKKKKKKKGQSGNPANTSGENPGGAPAGNVPPAELHDVAAMNLSPPRQHVYPYPPVMSYPTPLYGTSYSTAYPSTSTASYYFHPMHGNTYSRPEFYQPPPPPPPSHPIDTFNEDGDENGCSIM